MKRPYIFSIILAAIFGIGITWIDSQPTWDDTGITVLMVLIASFACGFIGIENPWLIALLVSAWIPLLGIVLHYSFTGLLALFPGFIGAYTGSGLKKMIAQP